MMAETFAKIAAIYCETKNASKAQRGYIAKINREIGSMPIADIEQMHVDLAASRLYPGAANATKNRQVYAPAAAVLHYAAKSKLRDYIQISKLKESDPPTRRPSPHVRDVLLANTEGHKRALLVFLFFQGWRISETLGLQAENIDVKRRTLRLYVSKAGRWKEMPMHDATYEALCAMEDMPDIGRVWPWRTRDGVYKWLRPLCRRLGVAFTPHMARHEFGGSLRQRGAGRRDLVDVGTWTSEKSVERYMSADAEHARDIIGRLSA